MCQIVYFELISSQFQRNVFERKQTTQFCNNNFKMDVGFGGKGEGFSSLYCTGTLVTINSVFSIELDVCVYVCVCVCVCVLSSYNLPDRDQN